MNFNDRPDISPFDPYKMSNAPMPRLPEEEAPLIGELPGLDISDLSVWADDRLSIYATLDAAMTKTIVEAVQSLNDLRRRVEEDSVARTLKIATERDQMRREVEKLQEDRKRLQEQISEAQHQLENERARKYNLEKECEILLAETRATRDNLQQQIALFTQQMSQMQTFFEQRMADWWQNMAQNASPKPTAPPRSVVPPDVVAFSEKPTAALRAVTPAQLHDDEPTDSRTVKDKLAGSNSRKNNKASSGISPTNLIEFTEAPTPSIVPSANKAGTAVLDKPPVAETMAEKEAEVKAFTPVEVEMNSTLADSDATLDEGEALKLSQMRAKRTNQTTVLAEQRLEHLLRRRQTDLLPGSEETTVKPNNVETQNIHIAPSPKFDEERALMEELGAKLGLEINTPPDAENMLFAAGYTPPPMPIISNERRRGRIEEIFKTPTPEPAHIGELPDNAIQWREETLSPFITPPKPAKPEPAADKAPTPQPPKRRTGSNYPLYPLRPPSAGSSKISSEDAEAISLVTISNLNGRSLLMMEKIVRSLPGVRHVTVTAFNKGELVMEVRHDAGAELDKIMPLQPELSTLKMIKHGPGELEFVQDSPKML